MKTLKRNMLLLISLLIAFFVFIPNISDAAYYSRLSDMIRDKGNAENKTVEVSYSTLTSSGNTTLYCIQHGIGFTRATYTVKRYIHITGNVAENKNGTKKTSQYNGVLAYAIGTRQGHGSGGGNYTAAQQVIYNIINNWFSRVGSSLGINLSYAGNNDLANLNQPAYAAGNALYKKAWDEYAKVIGSATDNLTMVDKSSKNATSKKVGVQNVVENNVEYVRVGPLKYQYNAGTMSAIAVKDQNGKTLSVTFEQKKNNTYQKINVKDIKSNASFYIKFKASDCVTRLTVVPQLKLSTTKIYSADLWFLQSSNGQNLLYTQSSSTTVPTKNFTFNYSLTSAVAIEKVDKKDNTIKLKNVQFVLKNLANNKFVKVNSNGIITFVSESQAQIYITGSDGKIYVGSLPPGPYQFIEKNNPNEGYEDNVGITSSKIYANPHFAASGKYVKVENSSEGEEPEEPEEPDNPKPSEEEDYGIIKYIKDTDVRMEGVRFKVWVKPEENPGREPKTSDSKYWTNRACTHALINVNEGKTDAEGNPLPEKWERPHSYDRVYTGASQYAKDHEEWEEKKRLYDLYVETSAWLDGEYTTDANGQITFPNLPTDLTYYAQEIALPEDKKDYFDIDNPSVVTLIPGSVNTFTDTRIAIDLEGLVWQEEGQGKQHVTNNLYDSGTERLVPGIKVVLKKGGAEVDSTTTDSAGHYEFKKLKVKDLDQYTVEFEYNGMKYYSIPTMVDEEKGSKASDIQEMRDDLDDRYNTIDKSQETNASDTSGVDYSVSDYKSEIIYRPNDDYAQPKYNLRASTEGICDLSSDKFYNPANDYIYNINLGIKEREQPDLALTEDIDRVEVSFNGTSHTFKYGERTEAILNQVSDNMTEKFTGDYANMSYTRTLFPSDIAHPSDSLEVKAVYKIGLENQATTLAGIVNEFKFYFDDGYEITSNEIDLSRTYSENKIDSIDVQNGVAVVKLNQGTQITAQTRQYVYVVAKVKTSTMEEMLIRNTSNEVTLNSVAEITSYTTLENGKPIAGVDVDSRPDSVDINNLRTFEDDTDRAPGLNLMLQEERLVSGTVFEDKAVYTQEQQAQGKTEEALNSGEERKGNGYYDDGEPRLDNITVRLTDTNGNTVDRYNLETNQWVPAETTTDGNGDYTIEGIIPGLYQIRYTWGDQEYIVENYKSTIVNESTYQAKLSDEHWYSESFKSSHNESTARYSDAVDDQELRKQVDEQSNDMKYQTLTEKKQGNTKMTSITPNFRVNYEYSQHNEEVTDFSNTEYTVTTDYKNGWTVMIKADNYNNKIFEIDLGIIRRAKQELELTKRAKRVVLTLQNGQILIDAKVIEKDGMYQLENNTNNTVYIPASDAANGMIKIETNNEIIQSANLSITYEFVVNNIGEVDYLTEEYYNYGKVPATEAQREEYVVKLKPESIIDYMDNAKISLQSEDWKLLEKPYQLVENGLISPEIEDSINSVQKVMQIDNVMKDENAYLSPVGMKNSSMVSIEMLVSKLLAPTEEFDVGNDAELIRSVKTGGSIVIETHGNYDPVNTPQEERENDDSTAEDVTILPPTGENQNYVIPIAIGITAFVVLGVGIVLIRKFVLK